MKVSIEVELDDFALLKSILTLARLAEVHEEFRDDEDMFVNLTEDGSLPIALRTIIVILDYWRDAHSAEGDFNYVFYGEMGPENVRAEWIESLKSINRVCNDLLEKMK